MTRVFDISNPHNAVEVKAHKIGDQVNMLSQSWDGKRIYFTSSLLANWDKAEVPDGEGIPQFFKAFTQDGNDLTHQFTIDFAKDKFICPQPYASWSLDGNDDWQAQVTYQTDTTGKHIIWDEAVQKCTEKIQYKNALKKFSTKMN